MKLPWALTLLMLIDVPVMGVITDPVGIRRTPVRVGVVEHRHATAGSGTSTRWLNQCRVTSSVASLLKVESYDWTRLRHTPPSARISGSGWASTGRISPEPGCAPTLLSRLGGVPVADQHAVLVREPLDIVAEGRVVEEPEVVGTGVEVDVVAAVVAERRDVGVEVRQLLGAGGLAEPVERPIRRATRLLPAVGR